MQQTPLAEMLRPKNLKNYVGQENLIGPPSHKASEGRGGVVRQLLENAEKTGFFPSVILWGPPGSGKTTLARIIANTLKREFYEFSAVNTKVKQIEDLLNNESGIKNNATQKSHNTSFEIHNSPIVFIDEIHRFNKAQQDKLLPHVENGSILLIGATTENPSFEVIGPLLSRTRVLVLKELGEKELRAIIKRALKHVNKKINKDAEKFILEAANGDARVLLNVIEIASQLSRSSTLSLLDIETALQRRQLTFDKRGEDFYNVISAFIKSMRASDVNAALYYLARMIEAGQDPLYIARRMVVFASEDIGMAVPTALVVANEVFRACETVGLPECQENLAHGVVYLSLAKKDRSSYDAYMSALKDVRQFGNLPVPMNIRNAPTKLMKDVGYGKGYEMYGKSSLLPEKLSGTKYYPDGKK